MNKQELIKYLEKQIEFHRSMGSLGSPTVSILNDILKKVRTLEG